ncbi:POZ domain-containing protein [Colletotrichum falcatum]|nr:POZ domain-containing protein [Colletotrichum falcatum]
MAESDKSGSDILLKEIAEHFNKLDHADVKIRIGEFELPAHGLVLAAHSPYFKKALKGNFQESDTRTFQFSEGSSHAYWRVFEFMYTNNYSETVDALDAPDDDELTKHVQVYVLADFFLMPELKRLAVEKLKPKLEELWMSEALVGCIKAAYDSTHHSSQQIRDVILRVVKLHISSLWEKKVFRDLVYEGGDFPGDLVGQFVSRSKG